MERYFPRRVLAAFILLIALANGAILYWHLYFHIWWLDIPMHLIGGLWVSLFVLSWYYRTRHFDPKVPYPFFVFALAIAATMSIGLFWELFEFSVDEIVVTFPTHSLFDTLLDLVMDFLGAVIGAGIFIRGGYNRVRS